MAAFMTPPFEGGAVVRTGILNLSYAADINPGANLVLQG